VLHRHHLLRVPFENIDMHLLPSGSRPLSMDPRHVFHKVVEEGRGALCYELAPLFRELLTSIGFLDVRLLSGRCFVTDRFGPEFDHALLLVDGRHLLDVGFGKVFLEPLDIQSLSPQMQPDGVPYKVTPLEDCEWQSADGEPWASGSLVCWRGKGEDDWEPVFAFDPEHGHRLDAFKNMLEFHQRDPASIFKKRWLCTLPTNGGLSRVTLKGAPGSMSCTLIRTSPGSSIEQQSLNAKDASETLSEIFHVTLPTGTSLESPQLPENGAALDAGT